MAAAVLMLCGFSDLSGQAGNIEVESLNRNWQVSMRNNTTVRAFNEDYQVEILFNLANLLPNSPQCINNKRIKDIQITLNIYKAARRGETNWAKSFEKTRIRFYGRGGMEERKIYGSNLIKNNQRFQPGAVVNIGTLEFLSPYTCQEIDGMSMRVFGMRDGNQTLPDLEFKLGLQD